MILRKSSDVSKIIYPLYEKDALYILDELTEFLKPPKYTSFKDFDALRGKTFVLSNGDNVCRYYSFEGYSIRSSKLDRSDTPYRYMLDLCVDGQFRHPFDIIPEKLRDENAGSEYAFSYIQLFPTFEEASKVCEELFKQGVGDWRFCVKLEATIMILSGFEKRQKKEFREVKL